MGDTRRSQTISAEGRKTVKQTPHETGRSSSGEGGPPLLVGETSFAGIKMLAMKNPEMVFTSLAHRIDLSLLSKAFSEIKRNDSTGVDEVTARKYAGNLDENLYNLHQRLLRGQYVATPVKRVWIEKEGGKKRPIGIPVLEDKIVQKAVCIILDPIFDVNFHSFSHGFRKEYGQQTALKELRKQCIDLNINWIVDADVSEYFGNIDHLHLKEAIKKRVNDGGILRLIGKWLNAGVMEAGMVTYPEKGTTQGGVISPLLANIFLHNVLDDWYVKEIKPQLMGRNFIIRFADDFIIGCELKSDAERLMKILPERFKEFGLTLHPEKTKLVPFIKPPKSKKSGKGSGTFDFLGFTFYWSRTRQGYWIINKKTIGKRLSLYLRGLWKWCKKNRHLPLKVQHLKLHQKLRGYYQYFGVRGNYYALRVVFKYAEKSWRFWLSRRSHKGYISWEKFATIRAKFPLPIPRIVHNI